MKQRILSISIPTYNRPKQLKELVESILQIPDDRIEIIVSDNQSAIDMQQILADIEDDRLHVYRNEEAVPGYYNMILGLFRGNGKYVIHCNDRDLLFTNELIELIDFLEKESYSYISTSRKFLEATHDLLIYDKGYDSILNQAYTRHPTGMVFNLELMKKYLNPERYMKYVDDTFTYCFLMRELLIHEKSAIYDIGCWNERPSAIKLKLKSGSIYKGGLYFEPDRIKIFVNSVVKHLIGNPYFNLTCEQEKGIILNIFDYFKNQLIFKKQCYADNRECAHYGMKMKYISVFELRKIYRDYVKFCSMCLEKSDYARDLKARWEKQSDEYMKSVLFDALRADKGILVKYIKRKTDMNYPY